MALQELMTWNADQGRWFKKYKGKMYAISAKQLGCEATKAASRTAANEWWTSKQAEIDSTLSARKHTANVIRRYEEAMENHRLVAKWHRKYGDIQEAQKSETFIEWMQQALKGENPPELKGWQFDPTFNEVAYLDQWHSQAITWMERKKQIQREEREAKNVPKENTVRAHIDHHLKTLKALSKNKIGTHDTYRCRLNAFRRWVEPAATLEDITEPLWERYCVFLANQVKQSKISQSTRAAQQVVARNFINGLWEQRLIELPRNLKSRKLGVSAPLQKIETFANDEIQAMLKAADERTRLYLLLGLNCGFYAVDIGTLRQDEVDWENGRIRRKRTKTRDRSNEVPEVDYLLWRQTIDLLMKHRNTGPHHPELALVNEEGNPLWWEKENQEGKVCRNNTVKCCYFRLQKDDLKLPAEKRKSWKILRKTSASKLEDHETYGRYAEYFLGEVPRSVAGRHYVKPSTKQFDAALKWLGKQLGVS